MVIFHMSGVSLYVACLHFQDLSIRLSISLISDRCDDCSYSSPFPVVTCAFAEYSIATIVLLLSHYLSDSVEHPVAAWTVLDQLVRRSLYLSSTTPD
jgi:hypothetical protein